MLLDLRVSKVYHHRTEPRAGLQLMVCISYCAFLKLGTGEMSSCVSTLHALCIQINPLLKVVLIVKNKRTGVPRMKWIVK